MTIRPGGPGAELLVEHPLVCVPALPASAAVIEAPMGPVTELRTHLAQAADPEDVAPGRRKRCVEKHVELATIHSRVPVRDEEPLVERRDRIVKVTGTQRVE